MASRLPHGETKAALRRFAIHIASQLPEDREEALAILGYARLLIAGFVHGDTVAMAGCDETASVLSLVQPTSEISSSSSRS